MKSVNNPVLTVPNEGKQLMMLRDISIWLDNYDDIFSDFDPRPYSERALSDDFIIEVRKVCKEKEEMINELKLLIPDNKRNNDYEDVIIKRLHSHFKKYHHQNETYYNKLWKKGVLFAVCGAMLMLSASYLSASGSKTFFVHLLLVIFEPAGWFLIWSGLDVIFFISKRHKRELNFYNKLSKSKISFFPIDLK